MICCIVKDAAGHDYLLSAARVFGSAADERIVQPAVRDGGREADIVADRAQSTETMSFAKLRPKIGANPQVLELGDIKGFESKPANDVVVVTCGFDGKRKEGKVVNTGIPLDIVIDPAAGTKIHLENVTVTSAILDAEIGAPVLTSEGKLVGMIFAASKARTVVLPVEPVLKKLGFELAK